MVLWQKRNLLQLIAECMFCNFITKALFYAKYFDIFVTWMGFLLNSLYNCAAKPINQSSTKKMKKCPQTFQLKRIISQKQMFTFLSALWLTVYLLIKVLQSCTGAFVCFFVCFFVRNKNMKGRKFGSRELIDHRCDSFNWSGIELFPLCKHKHVDRRRCNARDRTEGRERKS